MMVKVLKSFSGVHGAFMEGTTVELADDVARAYIGCGFLIEVGVKPHITQKSQPTRTRKQRMTKVQSPNVEQATNDTI